jgi:PTH1 family peptidyl-tRNA hydrolase
MKLIVGLGNPGDKYRHNRHNVGFMVLDELVQRLREPIPPGRDVGSIGDWVNSVKFFGDYFQYRDIILLRPDTFMNESGKAVAAISRFYKVKSEDIFIIHDDLDIPLGKYKIQHGKAPKVHNGLLSVEQSLGTDQYWNVRVGVENREVRGNKGVPGVVYSLQDFSHAENEIVVKVVEEVAVDLLTRLA